MGSSGSREPKVLVPRLTTEFRNACAARGISAAETLAKQCNRHTSHNFDGYHIWLSVPQYGRFLVGKFRLIEQSAASKNFTLKDINYLISVPMSDLHANYFDRYTAEDIAEALHSCNASQLMCCVTADIQIAFDHVHLCTTIVAEYPLHRSPLKFLADQHGTASGAIEPATDPPATPQTTAEGE